MDNPTVEKTLELHKNKENYYDENLHDKNLKTLQMKQIYIPALIFNEEDRLKLISPRKKLSLPSDNQSNIPKESQILKNQKPPLHAVLIPVIRPANSPKTPSQTLTLNQYIRKVSPIPPLTKHVAPSESATTNKKVCSCDRSNCLKLLISYYSYRYCECFKSGQMCQNCNCKNCFNNIENTHLRMNAINSILHRNKDAFKSRVSGVNKNKNNKQHRTGCNCTKSNCLKGYCECFQNQMFCGNNCKCLTCHNLPNFKYKRELEKSKICGSNKGSSLMKHALSRVLNMDSSMSIDISNNDIPTSKNSSFPQPFSSFDTNTCTGLNNNNHTKSLISQNLDDIIVKVSDVLCNTFVENHSTSGSIDDSISKILDSFLHCLSSINKNKN